MATFLNARPKHRIGGIQIGCHKMFGRANIEPADHNGFEFDLNHNVIYSKGRAISLSPHESEILHVLLNNRAYPTPIRELIKRVYGTAEPDAAAGSIRVAIHSLRKKIIGTGLAISAKPRVGYEIDASSIPELNNRLSDRILIALNIARSRNEDEIVQYLRRAYDLAETNRRKWLEANRKAAA